MKIIKKKIIFILLFEQIFTILITFNNYACLFIVKFKKYSQFH